MQFKQSINDFPLTVKLGEKMPSWGLSRWSGNEGLRFVPLDDEGFILRGDRRRLLYKGRRRSHRVTILNDAAFEYDCILEREPDNNVITLLMEGSEKFDFFRQPDFLQNPLLAGSYAVYKKETLVGEGTGKLCHIHRPEIIDAKGRRCWGDLSVVGNKLCITIPEKWLSDAAYPVIVDPTVGTSTDGSQFRWKLTPSDPLQDLCFECEISVNRFLVPDAINGACTAFAYTNRDDPEAGGRPVIYSDSGSKPANRLSANESFMDLRVGGSRPAAGWRSGNFSSNGSISSGAYIWFGISTEYFWYTRFDTGAVCYSESWGNSITPNSYPKISYSDDLRISMYFTYTAGQNYSRTLTQGVTLNDTRRLAGAYNRIATQVAGVSSAVDKFRTILHSLFESVAVNHVSSHWGEFFRGLFENTGSITETSHAGAFNRGLFDEAGSTEEVKRQGFFNFWLSDEAGNTTETTHEGFFYRKQEETVEVGSTVFRGLVFFVRIVTGAFVRDYLLERFLKAKSEIVIKSPVCREIILESKIN